MISSSADKPIVSPDGPLQPEAAESVPTEALITKYAVSGPRYTSYPTAVEFHPKFGAEDWRTSLEQEFRENPGAPLALYVHLPFCRSLCYFCACNKVITQDPAVARPYIEALKREFELYGRLVEAGCRQSGSPVPAAGQLHWGGGTPNFLSCDEIELVYKSACAFFQLENDADISIEIDPRTTTAEQISRMAELGFNRISLGVQDFDPDVQAAINRIQSIECTVSVVDRARAAGFGSINIDLIYGLPLQAADKFRRTIEQVLIIRPERIALYGYAHVTWLTKVQRTLEREHLPSPGERIALFILAVELLTAAGYVHIGMDHFALPADGLSRALSAGTLNRNFMGYSTIRGSRLLGFGASSISTLGGAFAQNVKDVDSYKTRALQGGFATERGLRRTKDDQLRGEVIEEVMCRGVIRIAEFEARWGIQFFEYFQQARPELEGLEADGLVRCSSDMISVTPLGRHFQRNVAMIFDAYLPVHREGQKKVFSQAV